MIEGEKAFATKKVKAFFFSENPENQTSSISEVKKVRKKTKGCLDARKLRELSENLSAGHYNVKIHLAPPRPQKGQIKVSKSIFLMKSKVNLNLNFRAKNMMPNCNFAILCPKFKLKNGIFVQKKYDNCNFVAILPPKNI